MLIFSERKQFGFGMADHSNCCTKMVEFSALITSGLGCLYVPGNSVDHVRLDLRSRV